ncbi:MAG: DegT/DnrJ/EryC1/StrS family aminotransferase, partial [Planctomycetia bacterium]|nr:DegT/DnrJ/EryC1/StrS family aminotransferase [Planctomycetia bacterium]
MTSNGNEKKSANSRRDFLKTGGVVAAGMYLGGKQTARAADKAPEALALDGGPKAVTKSFGKAGKWPQYGEEEIEAVTTLLKDPNYGSIAKFEEAWKKHFGAKYVKAHCNGTSALGSAFFALELPPGSEVLVSSYSTWFPLVPARFFGIVPRFVDVDPKTFNIDIEDCKRRLTKETKAIMPVHWWGLPCEMDLICDFAKEHGLEVIEDCSHAHGASLKDTNIGNWGRVAGFSLQASKPLPSIEGGIGVYKDQGDYERATTYGNYDLPSSFPESSPYRKYQGTAFGSKLRMHPISAILADLQLQRLAENNRIVGSQVRKLNDRITQLPGLTEPTCRPDM